MATPYDGRILWVHWMGRVVAENSIDELAKTVKQYSPNVTGIAIKTNDGEYWQGRYDSNTDMAINGPDDILRWAKQLARNGLQTHLWCVIRGDNIDQEVDVISRAASVRGVRSMILDVEVGSLYFGGKTAEDARRLITGIKSRVPSTLHLALNFDARGTHPRNIHIDEWLPYVQSLHPMVYHWHFSEGTRGPKSYLDEAFRVCSQWNKPVIPMLQAYRDPATGTQVPEQDVTESGIYSFQKGAAGISYFRLGSAGPEVFESVSEIDPDNIPPIEQPGTRRTFQVITNALNVRSQPTTEARTLLPQEQLRLGERIEVLTDSRTVNEGYVWWEHETGWSAEMPVSGNEIYLSEVAELPPPPFTFQRLPVDLNVMRWFYYYGNTVFAYRYGRYHNYDGYSQGIHGGLDFGHPGGVPIFAGVNGVFDYSGSGRSFGPNRVDVYVDDTLIIYGHVANPIRLPRGARVTPDTVIGEMDFGARHLHLEIRTENQRYIVNPLYYIDESTRNALFRAFPAEGIYAFYESTRWNRWQTPMDQPTIVRGGPVIGPRAV